MISNIIKRLAVAWVMVLVWATSSALAATLNTNAIFSVNGSVVFEDPQSGPPPDQIISTESIGAGFADAGANVGGATSVRAAGAFADGLFDIRELKAQASFSDTITNAGPAQNFFYDFFVSGPVLEVLGFGDLGDPILPTASYMIDILVDGTSVFHSAATLTYPTNPNDGPLLDTSGVELPIAIVNEDGFGGASILFADFFDQVFLGTLGPGESFLFETVIMASFSGAGLESFGGAAIGDPGTIGIVPGLSGFLSSAPVDAQIPLPAALPLLAGGLGLIGLVGWRRRRRASTNRKPGSAAF